MFMIFLMSALYYPYKMFKAIESDVTVIVQLAFTVAKTQKQPFSCYLRVVHALKYHPNEKVRINYS